MNITKALPAMIAAGVLTVATATAASAQATRPFTWATTMTPTCTVASCAFTLNVTGLGADLLGTPMTSVGVNFGPIAAPPALTGGGPAAIAAPITTPGFIEGFFINIVSGPATFVPGTYNTGNLNCTATATTLTCSDPAPFAALPQTTANIPIVGSANSNIFSYNGTAYLGNSSNITVTGTNGVLYDVGSFNGRFGVVPEPETMALLASGLVALGFAARRRRR